MLWPAFMFEAGDFLRLRETSSFCNTGQEKSPASPLQSINRGHILLERGSGDRQPGRLASLGTARDHTCSAQQQPPPPAGRPHQVASTVKIDLSESICLPLLSAAGSWSSCIYFKNLIAAAYCDHLNTGFFEL